MVDVAAKETTIHRCSTVPTLLVDIFSHSLVHTDFLNVWDIDRFRGEVKTSVISQPHSLLRTKVLRLVLDHQSEISENILESVSEGTIGIHKIVEEDLDPIPSDEPFNKGEV